MKSREELERLIVDASDGLLNSSEINNLERELQHYPDLNRDYRSIMNLPGFGSLYHDDLNADRHHSSIQKIRQGIRNLSYKPDSFEIISLNGFKRYALAASLAVFAVTSIFTLQRQRIQPDTLNTEEVVQEFFYPADNLSLADSYVLYLEELPED